MYYIRKGRSVFFVFAVAGAFMLIDALAGIWSDGFLARLGIGIAGLGLIAGSSGTLALSFGKLAEEDIFPIKVITRVGFMLIGPAFILAEAPDIWSNHRWEYCLGSCALTILPFGISLLLLVMRESRKRNSNT